MTRERNEDVRLLDHALARDLLTQLRDVETEQVTFRKGLVTLGRLAGYELIDSELPTETVTVQTPLTETTGERVAGMDGVVVVNVLRAATPLVEGLLKAFPAARQGVVSASRDEERGRREDGRFPVDVEYVKLPDVRADDTVVVADPMLATGSTMCAVLDHLRDGGATPENLLVVSVVAAPEGIERVGEAHPDAEVLTVAVDDHLDENGFIVPGLGDAGDRAFGTD